jgi:hypothetical protein
VVSTVVVDATAPAGRVMPVDGTCRIGSDDGERVVDPQPGRRQRTLTTEAYVQASGPSTAVELVPAPVSLGHECTVLANCGRHGDHDT